MGRGGYRPGAGRKPGSKKSAEISEETQQIRDMLALKTKAKAKLFNDLLGKIKSGGKVTISEKKLMDILAVELAAEVSGDKQPENSERLEPLDYMLSVMNDPMADKDRRDRMAIAAAPFVHPRIAEGKGKKQEKDEKAKTAGAGKFAPGRPPLALVK
jgi:hypothetical protein